MDEYMPNIRNQASSSNNVNRDIPNARIRRGECPDCGLKTHRVGRFNTPKPLTVPGYVLNGLCLLCNPIMNHPIVAAGTRYHTHRIEKIMTDGENSLVSALTFEPTEQHSFQGNPPTSDLQINHNNTSSNNNSLIHTEIAEAMYEDDENIDDINHEFITNGRTLTVEEAIERGKIFAQEEELSIRFSEEDMYQMKYCSPSPKEHSEVKEEAHIVNTTKAALTTTEVDLHPQEEGNDKKLESEVSPGPCTDSGKKKKKSIISRFSLSKHTFGGGSGMNDDKHQDFKKGHGKKKEPQLSSPRELSLPTAAMSLSSSSKLKRFNENKEAAQDQGTTSFEPTLPLQPYKNMDRGGSIKSAGADADAEDNEEFNVPQVNFKRSQSEGRGLHSNNMAYDYPYIPPPPLPNWESQKAATPALSRFISQNTDISTRATNGALEYSKRTNKEFSSGHTGDSQQGYTLPSRHPNGAYPLNKARNIDGRLKLKRFNTAPVEKEAITTGVKKMVSFQRSKMEIFQSVGDNGTSSSLSWCSETHSQNPYSKNMLSGGNQPTPVLCQRHKHSDTWNVSTNTGSSTPATKYNHYSEDKNYDSDLSSNGENSQISEKVKKMRDEDENFIDKKIMEMSTLGEDYDDENGFQHDSMEEEKILKTRLTQLGSSTSRDLDHAFISHQLRKLNLKDNDEGSESQEWANHPPVSGLPQSSYREENNGGHHLSTFFQKNHFGEPQDPAVNLLTTDRSHSKFDPNKASLVSDDDEDDEELFMNQTRLGLNNLNPSRAPIMEHTDFTRPSTLTSPHFDNRGNNPNDYDGPLTSSQSHQDPVNTSTVSIRINNMTMDENRPNSRLQHSVVSSEEHDTKKPPAYEEFNALKEKFNFQDEKTLPTDGNSTNGLVMELIENDASTANISLLIRLMTNRSSSMNNKLLYSALTYLQSSAVQEEQKNVIFEAKGIAAIVEIMWNNLDHPDVQAAACGALWSISSDCADDQKQILAESGAAEAILCGMQGHLNHPSLLVQVCGVLGSFCLDEDKFHLMNMGVIMSIVSVLNRHPNHRLLQIWSIRALWALSKDDASGERIIEIEKAGCVDLLYMAMNSSSHAELWEWGCRLLWCMSRNYVVAKKMLEKEPGLMRVIMSSLDQQFYDKGLACSLLSNFAGVMEENITELGGIPISSVINAVVSLMKTNRHSEHIHIGGCSTLSSLVRKTEANRITMASCGGLPVVFDAMKYFSKNETIEEQTCSLLFSCCECSSSSSAITFEMKAHIIIRLIEIQFSPETRLLEILCGILASLASKADIHDLIMSHRVLPVLVDLMHRHEKNPSMQEVTCTLICNLTQTPSMLDPLVHAGAIGSLLNAMKAHTNVLSIQELACISFWNLSTGSSHRSSTMIQSDVVQAIISVMQTHDQSEIMQELACGALWSLASNDHYDLNNGRKKSIICSNGTDAIVCAMFTYPNSIAVMENASGALSALSVNPSSADELISSGVIEALNECMRCNTSSTKILEYACITLRNLFILYTIDEQVCTSIVHAILRSMRGNPHEESLQRHACCALWSLTSSGQAARAKNEILSGGGMDLLMSVLEHTEWERETHREAREALETLII